MRYIIGLTGGIACGKSVVSDIFEKQGIPIIDTDIISRRLMQKGEKCFYTFLLLQFSKNYRWRQYIVFDHLILQAKQ